jgi:hypothetical protein
MQNLIFQFLIALKMLVVFFRIVMLCDIVSGFHCSSKMFAATCKTTCNNLEDRTNIKMIAFWDIAPCSLVGVDRCFGGAYCLHHQGDESWSPWWWSQYSPMKHQSTPMKLHGIILHRLSSSYLPPWEPEISYIDINFQKFILYLAVSFYRCFKYCTSLVFMKEHE